MSWSSRFRATAPLIESRMHTLVNASILLFGLALSNPLHAQATISTSSNRYGTAQALFQQGHLSEAEVEIHKQMQSGLSAEGFNLLGLVASSRHTYAEAVDDYHHALSISPDFDAARINLANTYIAQKHITLAKQELRTVLQRRPTDPNANYDLAVLLLSNGSPKEAIPYFLRVHPADLSTSFGLLRAYLLAQQPVNALSLATRISAAHKDNAQVHLSLGTMLASAQQYKAAQIQLEQAEALTPNDFDILLQLGKTSLLNGDNERADLSLSHAIKIQPDSPQALYLLAETYNVESRPLDALDLLYKANKLAPDAPDILYLMATVTMSQRFYDDATPLLQRVIDVAPSRLDAHDALGECYLKSGRFQQAVDEFTQVSRDHPSARTYAYLGLSEGSLGHYEKASGNFNSCLARQPGNNFCLFQLGRLYNLQGRTDDAAAIFQKVLRSNPVYADALAELADIEISKEQYLAASSLLTRYIAVSDHPASGYYKLGMIERHLHNAAKAKAYFAKFQSCSRLDPPTYHSYNHLSDYLDTRSTLDQHADLEKDVHHLIEQHTTNPNQPETLYDLAAAYLQLGNLAEAMQTISQLNQLQRDNSDTLLRAGVLLAQHRIYKDAITEFTLALDANPASNNARFNLADAYFKLGLYVDAKTTILQVSSTARDDAYLSLLGDIYNHLGETGDAEATYRAAIARNRYYDQNYLSLALLKLNEGDVSEAQNTLLEGQRYIPASGEIVWGLGITNAVQGNTLVAEKQLQHAVDMLPEWQGTYSTLGVLYYETGQIAQARDLLQTFEQANSQGTLNIAGIEKALSQASVSTRIDLGPLSAAKKQQLLQFATLVVDKTL